MSPSRIWNEHAKTVSYWPKLYSPLIIHDVFPRLLDSPDSPFASLVMGDLPIRSKITVSLVTHYY
ncbi:hypothetical protein E2C01_009421 [Portunus trituberculatus]|uniref:Uncharacterized protein n=1 Tax=Portunus trituberculatus TaxID=210409 RepID=A0A5B7D3H6_PORTR|nr:hypothetical protein [Portunus trituberculatus]